MPARTLQLKLRTSDFHTITRARTVPQPTTVDSEVFAVIRELFRENWKGEAVRLLGVHASHFDDETEQLGLSGASAHDKWNQALSAADRMREKFGENAVSLAAGLKARFREKTHDNPASMPGKRRKGRAASLRLVQSRHHERSEGPALAGSAKTLPVGEEQIPRSLVTTISLWPHSAPEGAPLLFNGVSPGGRVFQRRCTHSHWSGYLRM